METLFERNEDYQEEEENLLEKVDSSKENSDVEKMDEQKKETIVL